MNPLFGVKSRNTLGVSMLLSVVFLAACSQHVSLDSDLPDVVTITADCPSGRTIGIERLGEPLSVEVCSWDGVGWWCEGAPHTVGRDLVVVECGETGGELRVSWWLGGGE